jgi:hypothetical protein
VNNVDVDQHFEVGGGLDAYQRALIRSTAREVADKTAAAIAEQSSTSGL